MKVFLLLLLSVPLLVKAQSPEILKLANEVSVTDLKANLERLAAPGLEGSFAGTKGDTMAAGYIRDWFKKYRLVAPYHNGTGYLQSVPLEKIVISKAQVLAAGKQYQQFSDWYLFPNSTARSVRFNTLPIVFGGYGIVSDKYNDLLGEDLRGKVVIIVQVQPADKIAELLARATRTTISSDYVKNLAERGAAGVLVVTNDFERSSGALKVSGALRSFRNPATILSPLPRIYVSEKMINEILQPNDVSLQSLLINMRRSRRPLHFLTKATIDVDIQLDSTREEGQNIIGVLKGKDTTAEAVVLSSHHDHLGKRGGQVFSGASDNAASSAMLMEIAKLLQQAAAQGQRPKRTIIFASFTAEEIGLLGSYHYTENPLFPDRGTWAAYTLAAQGTADSIHQGKADNNYTCFLVRDTLHHGLLSALMASNEQVSLHLDDRFQEPQFLNRWLIGTDAVSFYMKGIPVIQTGSGYPKSYHQTSDTAAGINYPFLALQTKQAFLTVWNLANK